MTTKHTRGAIRFDQVEAFLKFIRSVGAETRAGKGEFQIAQVQLAGGKEWHAVGRNAQNIVVTPPALANLISMFKYSLKHPAQKPIEMRSVLDGREKLCNASDSAQQYACDLRDDAAIEFMGSLMLKVQIPTEHTDEQMLSLAKTAYRMADALLIAGGHA